MIPGFFGRGRRVRTHGTRFWRVKKTKPPGKKGGIRAKSPGYRPAPRACLKIEEVPEFLFQRERFQGGNRKKYCRISRISNTENRPFGAKRRCLRFFKQALVFMRVPGFFHILAYRKAGPFWVLRVLKTYTRAENFEAGRKTRPASSCCPCQIDIPPTTR